MLDIISFLAKNEYLSLYAVVPHKPGNLKEILIKMGVTVFSANIFSCRYDYSENFLEKLYRSVKSKVKSSITAFSALTFRNENFDLVYSNTSDNYWGLIYSKLNKIKHISHVREFGLIDQNQMQAIGDAHYYRFLSNNSDKIIAISDVLYGYLIKEKKVLTDKVIRIYDDVGLKILPFQPRLINTDEINLLIVGSFLKGKGQEFIIEAVKKLKEIGVKVHLGLVGDDSSDYAKSLKQFVIDAKLENNITFYGFRNDINKLRECYDFAVVSSTSEAFGRVTIEAMMSSQLVIASDTGANPELIRDGESGILYKYGCLDSFCDCILDIQSQKYELEKIIKNGYVFSSRFYQNKCGKEILNLIIQ
ncbi:TPA: glycosyltransferase family 4 protein [Photobacterium damselae]